MRTGQSAGLLRPRIGRVIARRGFVDLDRPQARVEARVGAPVPHQDARGAVWVCPYQLRGIGQPTVRHAFGEDTLQALEPVFQAIRHDLEATGRRLTWAAAPSDGASLGIARPIPWVFGPSVEAGLCAVIERELARKTASPRVRAAPDGSRP